MLAEKQKVKQYQRKVTPMEGLLSRSPYSIVTMVARIKGSVSEGMLVNAVAKVQQRHPNLRVRMQVDDHDLWFTSEGVGDIPIKVVARASDDHWMEVFTRESRIPFEFETRPAIRFILVQSPAVSELIILCHHVICDGLSLAYLARDVLVQLGDPAREVEMLPDPVPVNQDSIPEDVSANPVVRFFINRINKGWAKDRVTFTQEDYEALNAAYWSHYHHRLFCVELSEAQTAALVARCKDEGVTVNTALTAAFAGAPVIVQGEQPFHAQLAVAGDLRRHLRQPVGEVMGFYASAVTLKYRYDTGSGFWQNARRLQDRLKPLYTNKHLFSEPLMWSHLEPGMLEALNFKRLGGLVPASSPRYQKLSAYSRQNDVVSSVLKRNKMESLDRVIIGTAVTNLTRMDFPRQYGPLELDRLMMHPGGAFPLATVNLVLGAVTCSGKLSLVIEYAEEAVDTGTMAKIKDQAMAFLLDE